MSKMQETPAPLLLHRLYERGLSILRRSYWKYHQKSLLDLWPDWEAVGDFFHYHVIFVTNIGQAEHFAFNVGIGYIIEFFDSTAWEELASEVTIRTLYLHHPQDTFLCRIQHYAEQDYSQYYSLTVAIECRLPTFHPGCGARENADGLRYSYLRPEIQAWRQKHPKAWSDLHRTGI